MSLWVLEDRVMEHVTFPGVPATGATFQPHIYVFQVQLDTSIIRTDLRLREKIFNLKCDRSRPVPMALNNHIFLPIERTT
jgi:hypothetical protein